MRYSWSKFGREAEYIIALYLKSVGWTDVRLSPGSRGPADIVAGHKGVSWFIQVKASHSIPRLRADELSRLKQVARECNGLAVLATLQPLGTGVFSTGSFDMNFYEVNEWSYLDPTLLADSHNSQLLKPEPAGIE